MKNHSRDPGLSQQSATAELGQSENDLCHCGSSVGPLPLTQKPWAPCHCATVTVPAPISAHSPLPVCPSAGGPFPPPFALTSLPLFGNFTQTSLLNSSHLGYSPRVWGQLQTPPPPTMTTPEHSTASVLFTDSPTTTFFRPKQPPVYFLSPSISPTVVIS